MSQAMWYLTRSTGIVAAILMVAALVWGFVFSARATGDKLRPAWWLDLHNWLGGLAAVFTGAHIVASLLDTEAGIGFAQVFVPGTADFDPWAITWGVIAAYLLWVVVFTTWPRRLGRRRWWRILHLTSVGATALALLHSYQSGSDATRLSFEIGVVALTAIAVYGLGLRLFSLGGRPKGAGRARTGSRDSQRALSRGSSTPNGEIAHSPHEH